MSTPRTWIEASGHRVTRLSDEAGSSSLYFNFNAYTPEGDFLVISTPTGIAKIELSSFKLSPVITIDEHFSLLFVGKTYRRAYYRLNDAKTLHWVDLDTGVTHVIAKEPLGDIQTINSDETYLAGVEVDPTYKSDILELFSKRDPKTDQFVYEANWPDGTPMTYADAKEVRLSQRLNARAPMVLFLIDVNTGERKDVYKATDWLNHLLFSPTDATILMFCHEGPWHQVDRLWLLDLKGDLKPQRIHERRMNMEIAGHEWFSHDGKTVWYDLQTPRGEDFWIAGYEIETGKRTHYHLERNEWSVHFHSSYDNSLFCGDGGDPEMVAHAEDGMYLYLFQPKRIPDVAGLKSPDAGKLIVPGFFESKKLVDLKDNDYRLEPNANFTPDGKYLVFRNAKYGGLHVYAVALEPEIA
ncbi:uncharacterized protein I303_106904 [Kwoniella dejecticola CBS 10117]|uniref:Oligogalacturonate lyase domain-containing protein n=1 Tax=Kwoniella dejecticola CBS 10117 TaxID=1296121 RepID=A0A1A5ZTI3_9TREE|nr:uncharacterized protein I303_08457 [Kwoniella dejecticola CBS 10117]OBR81075.1 hypothetical protein I303_08457 [Kwoniella dejecticola CBS 10117]